MESEVIIKEEIGNESENLPEVSRPTKHNIEIINEKKKFFQCLKCDQFFGGMGALKRHVTIVHDGGKMPFECSICQTKLPSKSAVSRHVAFVHEKKIPFECSICRVKFVKKGDLNGHIRANHKGKWKCSISI